ncbi:pilus biosynthesis protein HicB [Clostridia bacterium]|nr:pilus biosynthesis protein HicB [Clostridia bacterium]
MEAKDYLNLPYNISIRRINDGSSSYYLATVQEFDGCQSTGETIESAAESLEETMEGWIETKLQNGFPIPHPFCAPEYSGKFVLRVPKTLHKQLATEAEREGVSLNQYAVYKLAR